MQVRKILFLVLFTLTVIPGYSQEVFKENLSIDGEWEIIFDHKNEGRTMGWQLADSFETVAAIQAINVPSSWELIEKDYEGVAFYRKKFSVPESWKGRYVRLHFDAVNYIAEVWLNDNSVGYHEGGFTPFEFRVDEMINYGGENILTLRVIGPIILSDKRIDGIGKLESPTWRGGITGGIWQAVELRSTGAAYVKDVFIQPNIHSNTAHFDIEIDHTAVEGIKAELEIRVTGSDSSQSIIVEAVELDLTPGNNTLSKTIQIPGAEYWSPDHPFLYTAELILRAGGDLIESWSERFGMRELTIKDNDFYLNNEPVYIKATFFEGLYPNGIAYPDTEEMARKEIQLAKEAGFNMIRPWRHPPTELWLDLADEMGVLVVGSPVLECMTLPLSTPYLPWRVENEITQAILRDRNRACIVQWELFNELHRPVLKQMMRPMAVLTRELDPTRLILDESGGWAFGANMYLPGESEPTKFNDIHTYPGPFLSKNQFDGFLSIGMSPKEKKAKRYKGRTPGRNVVPGLMSFISELGYGSLPNLVENNKQFEATGNPLTPAYRYHKRLAGEQEEILKEAGFKELYPDMKQFYLDQQIIHGEANRRMIEAARSNPEVDGYCIHALVAGDWIIGAGLLDLWRNPKSHAYDATKAANQPRILVLRSFPRNTYAKDGITLEVTGVNELQGIKGELDVEMRSASGEIVWEKSVAVDLNKGVGSMFETHISTAKFDGSYELSASFVSESGKAKATNKINCFVMQEDKLEITGMKAMVLEKGEAMGKFLDSRGVAVSEFKKSKGKSVPLIVSGFNDKKAFNDKDFEQLRSFTKKGGTLVLAGEISQDLLDSGKLPFTAKVIRARGLWTCIPHIVKEHPLTGDLPVNMMMDDSYENVWAQSSLSEIEGEDIGLLKPVIATFAYDWFSRSHKMHYSGPGSSWWGSDLCIIPYGKGHFIVSQLRIVENLGKDPIADKILVNLLKYCSEL